MKKRILTFFGLVIIIGTTFFISCENENSQSEDLSALKLEMVNKYNVVGENHNRNLSLIFQDIKNKNITISTKEKFIEDFNVSLIKVVSNSNISKKYNIPQSEILKLTNKNYQAQFDQYKSNSSNYKHESLSIELKDLLERLIAISNNKELTIAEERELINYLDNEAVINLRNESDLNIYFGASSVAKYSFQYWANNIDQWISLLNKINPNKNKDEDEKDNTSPYDHELLDGVVGADVGGAVTGALAASLTGPVGWVAGGLIGSSAASSGKFVENAWNYFF